MPIITRGGFQKATGFFMAVAIFGTLYSMSLSHKPCTSVYAQEDSLSPQVAPVKITMEEAIAQVLKAKWMTVYPDGEFHASYPVDRATLAVITNKAFNISKRKASSPLSTAGSFQDVPNNYWAYEAIEEMARHKLMAGYRDNLFFPEHRVTRAEGFSILAQAYGLYPFEPPYVTELLAPYEDADKIPLWARNALATMVYQKLMNSTSSNGKLWLNPGKMMTRGDLAYALAVYLNQTEKPKPSQEQPF